MLKNDEDHDAAMIGDALSAIHDPRGGPPDVENDAVRRDIQAVVMSLVAGGHSRAQIAKYLRLDQKTLVKYFSRELDHGAALLDGVLIQVLVRRALEGNVSAAKEVRAIMAAKSAPTSQDPALRLVPATGKKAELAKAALQPTGQWVDLLN